jgi:hypothetical protein
MCGDGPWPSAPVSGEPAGARSRRSTGIGTSSPPLPYRTIARCRALVARGSGSVWSTPVIRPGAFWFVPLVGPGPTPFSETT